MIARVEAFAVVGIGEVGAGDDLAAAISAALRTNGPPPADGDILVVSSKVVSKAEGRVVRADTREDAVAAQTVRVVAERVTPRGVTRIVQSASGPVLAAAGVDNSNVAPGTVLLLPADPDGSARALRRALVELTGCRLGVLVSDTLGRPWRDGQVDAAIGASAVAVVDDLRGRTDAYGNPLEVTVRAVADEIAALADLVKGKVDGVPVALVRGLGSFVRDGDAADAGAATLLRPPGEDWFRYGHVEAVRAALGVPPPPGQAPRPRRGGGGQAAIVTTTRPRTGGSVPPRPVPPDPLADRAARALAAACAAPGPFGAAGPADLRVDPVTGEVAVTIAGTGDALAAGALAQRLALAAWTEDLWVETDRSPAAGTVRLVLGELTV